MVTLRLYLEDIAGDWFGWIESFPGAYCQGATPQEAVRAAPAALMDTMRWLREHGEAIPPRLEGCAGADFQTEVVETHHARLSDFGTEIHGFFPPDARPLDTDEIECYLALLRHAHADILKAARAIPPDAWDTAPFGGKSVRGILRHLADAEAEMLRCLRLEPVLPPPTDLLFSLESLRYEFENAVRAFPATRRGDIFTVQGERWTLRKALRRALWHARYHTPQLVARSIPDAYLRAVVVDRRLQEQAAHALPR